MHRALTALTVCLITSVLAAHAAEKIPIPINGILAAQAFKLAKPADGISAGTLVVLDVDPPLLALQESANPVLFISDRPITPLNRGDVSGHIVVIVPADIDISNSLIWFGDPALSESLTPAQVQAEIIAAKKLLKPLGKPKSIRKSIKPADFSALLSDAAAALVEEFAPDEKSTADLWRLAEAG